MTAWTGWLLLHLVLAATGTWIARRYALRRALFDQPGERRSHAIATPRGGGIAIVAAVLFGCVLLIGHWPDQAWLLACFATGLVLVATVGWIDDHRSLSPWLRLAVQALAGGVLAWGVYRSNGLWLHAWLAFGLVMVLANVWNFMDGIDGLAASQAALVAGGLALALGQSVWGWVAAGLAAAACGFLPFNFPRARIFLGDVGSGSLGFVLAALLVAGITSRPAAWPLMLLPMAAFLVDASFTLWARILRRERWWTPHVQHLYQRWARRQGKHLWVTSAYALFSLTGLILMLGALRWRPSGAVWIFLAWYAIASWVWLIQSKDDQVNKEADQ